jgi:16S rRNA (adenine1518-N6/adenine1519-N6)-dimethyltransferase
VIGRVTDRRVVRDLLAEAGVRPSKKLGQSFLVDVGVLADIERTLAGVTPETILEIGPGLGAVTEVLLRHARRVVAVEVDRRLAGLLGERLGECSRLEVRNEDVLRFDIAGEFGDVPVHAVGSLPYRITAPILKWLIDQRGVLSGALLITQREVAEKIAASPGKGGSALGILVRAYAEVDIMRKVGRGSFFPIPEVDSTLWGLTFLDRPRFASDSVVFFSVVRALYGTRRKMIRGALRALLPAEAIGAVLEEARIDGAVRGEELDFEQLDRLAAATKRLDVL